MAVCSVRDLEVAARSTVHRPACGRTILLALAASH
jgi:hypothetical protein